MILSETLILSKAKGFSRASTVRDLSRIKTINLWGQSISDVGFLVNLPQLEVIAFAVNNISDLSPFQYMKSLRELYLRQNQITAPSELIHLLHLPNLTELWISDNPFCKLIPSYRATLVRLFPRVTRLDDKEVTTRDREDASRVTFGDDGDVGRWLRGLGGGNGVATSKRPLWIKSPGEDVVLASKGGRLEDVVVRKPSEGKEGPASEMFMSRGTKLLQTSEMELRRLAAAIAELEQPGLRAAGGGRRRTPPEMDGGLSEVLKRHSAGGGGGGGGGYVNPADERPIRPAPSAGLFFGGEEMGRGRGGEDSGLALQGRQMRSGGRVTPGRVRGSQSVEFGREGRRKGWKEEEVTTTSPSDVEPTISPASQTSSGGRSIESSVFPVVSIQGDAEVTKPVTFGVGSKRHNDLLHPSPSQLHEEDHLAGPGFRIVHVEHHPPDGRIRHVMSNHQDPGTPSGETRTLPTTDNFKVHEVGGKRGEERRRSLATVHEEDHLSGSGMGFVHGVHVVPNGRIRRVVDDGRSKGGAPFAVDEPSVVKRLELPKELEPLKIGESVKEAEIRGLPPSRGSNRPSWLGRQGNETIVKNSIRDAGVLSPGEESPFDGTDPQSVKKTNVLYAIMTLLKELDPVSLVVVQHKVNLLING
ncbi:hypothetical protein HDU67_006829 [Dinochytrium kinnereticum]|nr:hypothetical protein HDU67_006829 [Dinochytrium kinnereticum]